ncbi:ABC transporter ATP-binding protein [Pandoraea sp. ISTKB]|uniref:ABC transporter ATP-binding protein n=1 Tax=Pandoraea sp. ISTKB TaxID=1586708 RepID=UPI00084799C5|nr:ABC transporter ATP-binding protein [Pandoraea sp. ISTKB]ODP31676.1 hypothetical protein A9762_06790 [Pandoraea sp. ISTKB]
MIRDLMLAGQRLSGQRDPRFVRGAAWAIAEGFWTAMMYPCLYGLLLDVMTGRAAPASIARYTAGMVLCLVLRILCGRIGLPGLFAGAYAMMGSARLRIADHLRRLPMGWFSRQRGGDLGARLTSDLELIEHLWSHFLGVFLSGLAAPVFLLSFLFLVDWRLACVVTMGLPIAWLAMLGTQRAIVRPGARLMRTSAMAHATLLEYVQGIAVVRSFGRFGDAWHRLVAVLDAQYGALLEVETKPAPWLVLYGFLLELGYLSLLLAGAGWLSGHTMSPVTLVVFLVVVLPVYRQLFEVGLATMMLRFSRRALVRIEALLAEPALREPVQARVPDGHDIVFEHVGFAYEAVDVDVDSAAPDSRAALTDIHCTLPAGGLTAIVGPSGAGKSTMVHLIARLWDVRQGAVRLGGVDVREIGTQGLQSRIACVFQDVTLFSGSVLDNLRIGREDASREEIVEAARRAQAHAFIEALPQGYDTVLDEGGSSLSGGERQRLSIARALLKNAPILLLDEATASVDPSAEAEIQRAIAELARGRTVVTIAHRLNSIRHADRILVLEAGRLVAQGTHDTLLRQGGLYARLWERQQQARDWQLLAREAPGR